MKKILYSLVIFIGLFIFADKVSAFELISPVRTLSYSSSQISVWNNQIATTNIDNVSSLSGYKNLKNYVDNKQYSQYGEYYACYFKYPTSGQTYGCFVSDTAENFVVFSRELTGYNMFGLGFSVISNGMAYVIGNNLASVQRLNSVGSLYVLGFYEYMYDNTFVLLTNVPAFYMDDDNDSTLATSDGYYFNNGDIVLINNNGVLELNTDYKTSLTPEPNIFEEEIDDINYSKMIFDFDLGVLAEREYILDLLFDFSTIGNLDSSGQLYDSSSVPFPEPYLEIVNSNGFKDIIALESLNESHNVLKSAWSGTYQETISSDITSLKLIIPMNATENVRYDIGLISYIPYTYSFEYDEELENYYEEIDLSNKYGVMFMPKLLDNDSSITSVFIYGGIDSIYTYDTYDYKQEPIETYSAEDGAFSYQFDRYDLNYNLFFVSSQKPLRSLVKYDTRYFTYKVVDSKYSIGTVTNPNTGENHYIDFSNTANVQIDFESIGDIFYFISDNLDSGGEAYLLFSNSVSAFFNTMPTDIYIFILTLLAVIFIGTLLALGGWR